MTRGPVMVPDLDGRRLGRRTGEVVRPRIGHVPGLSRSVGRAPSTSRIHGLQCSSVGLRRGSDLRRERQVLCLGIFA